MFCLFFNVAYATMKRTINLHLKIKSNKFHQCDQILQENSSVPSNLISVINMTDIAIKRIIRMAKKITPFIAMCQEDQVREHS